MRLWWGAMVLVIGCGSVDRMAIGTQARLMEKGSEVVLRERNWEWFRQTTPASLQMLEGLLVQDPQNLVLRRSLVKGYAGHAWAVSETLAWEERLLDTSAKPHLVEALDLYARALSHGRAYFAQKGLSWDELLKTPEDKLQARLSEAFSEDDRFAVLYTGHAWASSVQLNATDIALVSQVPKVKGLFDWVCHRWPDIEQGFCPLFYAQYELSRPKMLGGNPLRGEEIFQEFFKRHPKNLLGRVLRLQFAIIPAGDEDAFRIEADVLNKEFADFDRLKVPAGNVAPTSSYATSPQLNLYNAIAHKRWELMNKNRKHLF
jgi:hypothetical protein